MTERPRIAPMATHTRKHLETACRTIVSVGNALGLPGTPQPSAVRRQPSAQIRDAADGGWRMADGG